VGQLEVGLNDSASDLMHQAVRGPPRHLACTISLTPLSSASMCSLTIERRSAQAICVVHNVPDLEIYNSCLFLSINIAERAWHVSFNTAMFFGPDDEQWDPACQWFNDLFLVPHRRTQWSAAVGVAQFLQQGGLPGLVRAMARALRRWRRAVAAYQAALPAAGAAAAAVAGLAAQLVAAAAQLMGMPVAPVAAPALVAQLAALLPAAPAAPAVPVVAPVVAVAGGGQAAAPALAGAGGAGGGLPPPPPPVPGP
jgi:hypothetical protein